MKLKLNTDLAGYKKGSIVDVGEKPSQYWRNRIKDSKIDKCVEIVKKKKGTK